MLQGERVAIGSAKFLEGRGIRESTDPSHKEMQLEFGSDRTFSSTVVGVAINGKIAGAIAFTDFLKETTPEAIKALRAEGLRLVMLTGDRRESAAMIAGQLGLTEIEGEVRPEQKAAVIESLKKKRRVVAMAGDGINDAPALAAADVGIAMGTGTDIAIENSGITLVKGDLRGIVRARRLSRATVRNIKENLTFPFVDHLRCTPIPPGRTSSPFSTPS